jgi:hypothetical protein
MQLGNGLGQLSYSTLAHLGDTWPEVTEDSVRGRATPGLQAPDSGSGTVTPSGRSAVSDRSR